MQCLICRGETPERIRNKPMHRECRKEIGRLTLKFAEKIAKDITSKVKEGAIDDLKNYEKVLEQCRKSVTLIEVLEALEKGEL